MQGRFFTSWATREAQVYVMYNVIRKKKGGGEKDQVLSCTLFSIPNQNLNMYLYKNLNGLWAPQGERQYSNLFLFCNTLRMGE